MHTFSFRELAFEIQFNRVYRNFCRLNFDQEPSKSALQRDISRIEPSTWEKINRGLIGYAVRIGVENGKAVRTDCTVMESTIHHPRDSSLLWDSVRKLSDLIDDASKIVNVSYSDHRKIAKRRALAIINTKRMNKRRPLYRVLIKATKKTIGYARRTAAALRKRKHPRALGYAESISHFIGLAEKVISQAERRVFCDESVPAKDKIVSIFEEHWRCNMQGRA